MVKPTYDLIVRAGRVLCADVGMDGPGAVAVAGDRIVAAGAEVGGTAARVLEFPDGVLLPAWWTFMLIRLLRTGSTG